MSLQALQEYTFVSKYARYIPEKKRRETWNEAVERVKQMHLTKYPQIENEIEWAFEQVKQKKVLGSQRAMQFGGSPILKTNARIYNCCASYCDRIRFFQECFWLLLCGCGTGFSVQKHHIEKLPYFTSRKDVKKVYTIEDSIEGWADALGVLISSYLGGGDFPQYSGCDVIFDYSLIRPEGSPLRSSSGKAPGPKPLKNGLEKIRIVLDRCLQENRNKLRPIDAYDVIMHASDAVLSGGVRRSATICLFSPDDTEMAKAKTGDWFVENPQRSRSNNSALLVRHQTSWEQFSELMECVKQFGEPGFIFSDNTECLFNPCAEISLYAYDDDGNSGWQMCNLTEINGKKIKNENDFETAARAAAIIGTCQAGYDEFDYLGEVTERIVKREALLGVSITGMMDSPKILFDPELQRKMATLVLDVNKIIADKIGINLCSRATTIKPAGTTSCILGTASGIHPHHARRYIRRAQGNWMEAPLQYFKKINSIAVEKSVWSANGTDEVVSFCIEVPESGRVKNDLSAIELLKQVKLTRQNWIEFGTRADYCVQPWLRHNVSNTCLVRPAEWEDVADYIFDNKEYFAGISLLPESGDKVYAQAPFTAIHTPKEIVEKYGVGALMASGLIVDGLYAFNNNLWEACDITLGIIPLKESEKDERFEIKLDWIRRVKQFANRYINGDLEQTTYLLKDVNNWKLWCDLNREYKEVDYSLMVEESDVTNFVTESACSGGVCSLSYA